MPTTEDPRGPGIGDDSWRVPLVYSILQAMQRILPVLGALVWMACASPVDVTVPVDVAIEVGRPFPPRTPIFLSFNKYT